MLEKELRCPYCGRLNNTHAGVVDDDVPEAGNYSLCWGCRQVSAFTKEGDLRTLEGEELREAQRDPEVRAALQAGLIAPTPFQALSMTRRHR